MSWQLFFSDKNKCLDSALAVFVERDTIYLIHNTFVNLDKKLSSELQLQISGAGRREQ